MKNILSILLLTIIFCTVIIAAGCGAVVTGSGNLVTKMFDNTGFVMIEAGKGFRLELVSAASFGIEITCDDNVAEYLDIRQAGDTLMIDLKAGSVIDTTLIANISMPVLSGINLSEGASAAVSGFSSSNDFSVTLSGGSTLTGNIVTGDIGFGLSEGSSVTLTGTGNNLVARSSEGSRLTLEDFPIHDADINIDGGGRAVLSINGKLDTTLTGGSTLLYTGAPEMGEVSVSGGSVLAKK